MYNAKVLEIFKNPKNIGTVKGANGVAKIQNIACGDILKLNIRVSDQGIIEDAKFKAYGGPAIISSGSVAAQLLRGKSIEEAKDISADEILNVLGTLPDEKKYCLDLTEQTIKACIEDYFKKKEKEEFKTNK